MNSFSSKIILIRKSKKMSQTEFAQFLEIDPKTLYRWEKGETTPTYKQINDILGKLKIDSLIEFEKIYELLEQGYTFDDCTKNKIHKKRKKLSRFYKIWLTIFIITVVIIGFAMIMMWIVIKTITEFSDGNRNHIITTNGSDILPYLIVIFGLLFLPLIIHGIRKYIKIRKGEKTKMKKILGLVFLAIFIAIPFSFNVEASEITNVEEEVNEAVEEKTMIKEFNIPIQVSTNSLDLQPYAIYVDISIRVYLDHGYVYAEAYNHFTLGFATIETYVYLYRSEFYTEDKERMDLMDSNHTDDLNMGQSLTAEKIWSGSRYWRGSVRYKNNNSNWAHGESETDYI